MGLRVESDVEWKMNEAEQYKLSEDGFCSLCKEFHSDCFCEAFWIRKSASLKNTIENMRKKQPSHTQINDVKKELDNLVNAIDWTSNKVKIFDSIAKIKQFVYREF